VNLGSRQTELASRPQGWPTAENFRLADTTVGEPADGQIVVRDLVMNVDPYMRHG
jgi:NADPH-dependent curcumin reductase CurA